MGQQGTPKKHGILDEKGRLFGKINIIDLLVILLVVIGIAFFVIKSNSKGSSVIGAAAPQGRITYTVKVEGVEPQIAQEVTDWVAQGENGDQLLAGSNLLDGYVTAVETLPHFNYGTNSEGVVVTSEEVDGRVDLLFSITATVDNTTTNVVGTQEVRTGKAGHIVKTAHFELYNGVIMSCQPVE